MNVKYIHVSIREMLVPRVLTQGIPLFLAQISPHFLSIPDIVYALVDYWARF